MWECLVELPSSSKITYLKDEREFKGDYINCKVTTLIAGRFHQKFRNLKFSLHYV